MESLRSLWNRQEGASLVEFTITFGIFIAVTFGILILCWAVFTYEYVDYASREAARWASVRGSQCANTSSMPGCNADLTTIQNYVQGLDFPLINTNDLSVSATWLQVTYTANPTPGLPPIASWGPCTNGLCNDPGDAVRVNVSYQFASYIPFFGNFAPKVSSSSTWVISQ